MTRIITCESPEEYIWSEYLFLENEVTARALLQQKYMAQGIPQPEQAAFRNVQAFTDYIKQARAIFTTLSQNSLWVQPLLLYYGMCALEKAFVLTKDIHYPANTSVLRHGLSTRRRKRAQFRFFQDEIRVQKEGLFPHLAQVLDSKMEAGDAFKSEHLLSVIPEIQPTYEHFFQPASLISMFIDATYNGPGTRLQLAESVLDYYHVTALSFIEKLNREVPTPLFQLEEASSTELTLLWKNEKIPHVNAWEKGFAHPWVYENIKGDYYLWTGSTRYGAPVNELLAQHMLVFALSMICRYETTLWGEIVYSSVSEDAIIIQQLLSVVRRKFPQMVLNLIREEKLVVFVQ